ncbi:MAG: organoarsenical effux MFS transporter ArsJ [Chromatiales bacterium]|jgi:predicted MFS family arabinose efflux permease
MDTSLKNYLTVTGGYWAFTITDGAIRMLVVLYFHELGYSPLEIAMLFLFYEFFGVVTNLVGGWIGSRVGLNLTMHIGMLLQVLALLALTVPESWLSVAYVMAAQALSGIAKDLNKMSAKASVKLLLPKDADNADQRLFRWVSVLTGSKNSLKGAGFFLGGLLLGLIGFRGALLVLAGSLFVVFILTLWLLPRELGKTTAKAKIRHIFSKTAQINWLSAARFFLFGSRDVWFVVGLPVFLYAELNWSHTQVGSYLALWIIGYGLVQAFTPGLIRKAAPSASSVSLAAFALATIPAGIAVALSQDWNAQYSIVIGLIVFGIIFAINSAIHSFMILAWSDHDKVAMNVGFYYMANAGGRLTGTVISGWAYQKYGLSGCLWWSVAFVVLAGLLSLPLMARPAD